MNIKRGNLPRRLRYTHNPKWVTEEEAQIIEPLCDSSSYEDIARIKNIRLRGVKKVCKDREKRKLYDLVLNFLNNNDIIKSSDVRKIMRDKGIKFSGWDTFTFPLWVIKLLISRGYVIKAGSKRGTRYETVIERLLEDIESGESELTENELSEEQLEEMTRPSLPESEHTQPFPSQTFPSWALEQTSTTTPEEAKSESTIPRPRPRVRAKGEGVRGDPFGRVKNLISKFNLAVITTRGTKRGHHNKIIVPAGNGQPEHSIPIASTPSDWRADLNSLAQLKRALIARGFLTRADSTFYRNPRPLEFRGVRSNAKIRRINRLKFNF